MKKIFIILFALITLSFTGMSSKAITLDGYRIGFDDYSIGGSTALILNGYYGFNWENFIAYEVPVWSPQNNGYFNGLLSAPNEAYSWSLFEQTITKSIGGTFSFTEIWATAANNDANLYLSLEGKLGGITKFSDTFKLTTAGPTYKNYAGTNMENIDTLILRGVINGSSYSYTTGISPSQYQYVLDAPPVPEPSSIIMGLLGLSSLLGIKRKKAV